MGIKETKELNKLLVEQAKIYEQQQKSLKSQLQLSQQLIETIRGMDIDRMSRGFEDMNTAVKEGAQSMEKLGQSEQAMRAVGDAVADTTENSKDLNDVIAETAEKGLALATWGSALEGAAAGFKFTKNAAFGLFGVTQSLIGSFFNLGAAIISAPFKVLGTLMNAAQGYNTELRQAMEDVRKEFGALSSNEGQAVIKSFRQINHFGGQLAETGLSIWRTMGNMAEVLKRVNEMASALGPTFSSFISEFTEKGAVERLHAYQKGLGLTDEAFRALGEQAIRQQVSIQEMGRRITSVTYAMGEAVGVNGKLISRDVGNMIDDFDHFGNVGVKELAQVSVYARKLGVEVEKLTGVLDQFSDFDKAAESVAQLSQAFGIQLNTLELVQEQDPAANIERLRKSFFAAGRSIETMTRQERALLATHTGLDQKTLSLAFSQQKQGMSYADIQKQGESAEKQQLSQAEAMAKLSDSIERLVKQGPKLANDFFTIFGQGFLTGMKRTKSFYGLMRSLNRAMRITYRTGRRVGQMFVNTFPGIKDVFEGIKDIFSPQRFRKLMKGIQAAFKDFFEMMTTDPKTALPKLLEKLKENFFNWFNSGEAGGRKILDGIKKFATAFMHIFTGLIKEAIKGTTKIFQVIAQTIKDPSSLISGMGQAQTGVAGFLMDIFKPLYNFFSSSEGKALLSGLWESFVDLMAIAWEKIKPKLMKFAPIALGALFAPSVIAGLSRGVAAAIGGAFIKGSAMFLGSGAIEKTKGLLGKGMSSLAGSVSEMSKASSGAAGAGGSFSPVSAAAQGAKAAAGATKGFGAKDAAALGLKLLAISVAISIGAIPMAMSVIQIKKILDSGGITSVKDASGPLAVVAASALSLALLSPAVKALGGVNPAAAGKALLGAIALAVLAEGMAWHAVHLADVLSGVKIDDAKKMATVVGAMTLAYAAAGGIVLVGAGIAALVAGTAGIGALAIIAGVAALALVVEGMTFHALHIMDLLNTFNAKPGFVKKVSAFAKIIEVIGSMTGNLSNILNAAGPSFFGMLSNPFGRNPQRETQNTLGKVVELIEAIGGETRKIIDNIIEHIKGVSMSDLKKGLIVADILDSVASLTKALQPPPELADPGFFSSAPATIGAASKFVKNMSDTLKGLIPNLTDILKTIQNDIPDIDSAKLQAVSSLFTGLGSLFDVFVPKGGTGGMIGIAEGVHFVDKKIEKAKSFLPDWMTGGAGAEKNPAVGILEGLKTYTKNMLEALTPLIPSLTSFVNKIIASANEIKDVEKAKVASEIFGNAVKAITSFTDFINPESLGDFKNIDTKSMITAIGGITVFASRIAGSLKDIMPKIFDSFSSATAGKGAGNAFEAVAKNIEHVSNFTKGVSSIDFEMLATQAEAADKINVDVISRLETGVGALIETTNNVGKKLRAGSRRAYNIDAELQSFANNFGLKSTGKLEIAHQPIQFNVNWNIQIDAEELEKVLLEREGGRFSKLGPKV